MSIKSQIQNLANKPLKSILDKGLDERSPISEHIAELISLNEDASRGFERAAVMMDNDQDGLLFTTYANQRARFASTLRASHAVDEKAGAKERSSFAAIAEEFAAQAHRAWISLRASLSDSKLRAMLQECLRGDESLLPHYDHAIKASPSRSELHDLLTNQRADIKAVTETLRRLINETESMS